MRRVLLLALLTLALPTVALATTFDVTITAPSGSIVSDFMTNSPLSVNVSGNGQKITLDVILGECGPGNPAVTTNCSFNDAIVTASNAAGDIEMFTASGQLRTLPEFGLDLSASLLSLTPPLKTGLLTFHLFKGAEDVNDITTGTARLIAVVPEPGTLGLLGTGLIGLAGIARRKLKLWT